MAAFDFNKIDLSRKVKTGLGTAIVVLIVASSISYYNITTLISQNGWVTHTYEVLGNLENMISLMKDAETGQRGYLLTKDQVFLERYKDAYKKIFINYDKVKFLTHDNAKQQQALEPLKLIIDDRFIRLESVLVKFNETGKVDVDMMLEGKRVMDACRIAISEMKAEEEKLLLIRTQESQKFSDIAPILITSMSIFAVIISMISFIFINRDIKNKVIIQKELTDTNETLTANRNILNKQNFILSGIALLNKVIREEKDLHIISGNIIKHLCEYLNAHLGAFYILEDDGSFHFSHGYAFEQTKDTTKSFRAGEGLLGEAALQKKLKLIDQVPADALKIKTGLSVVDPQQILIVPFYFNEGTVAVAEIVNKNTFSETDLEYIAALGDIITISINRIKAEMKTLELLNETQNQAEELETQQEELRQINMELNTQKEHLIVSEEELKTSQEELQEKNTELEEKAIQLEEQYDSLRVSNKEIEEAKQAIELKVKQVETISKYKTEFLANMSHELRTPLNSILILSKLLEDETVKTNAKQSEKAKIIHSSGNDLLKLINEILDLSKIEAGQINLEVSDFEIKDIHPEREFERLALEKQINFGINYGKDLPKTIATDKFRLEQILKNLLSNAFKFTDKGGKISLNIFIPETNQIFKSESLRKTDKIVAFSITDTGIGVPKDKQELIFEAFQQADASTTRKFGGTGLGLSICRELALILGGEIKMESEENKGSAFILYIPMQYSGEVSNMVPSTFEYTREEIKAVKEEKTEKIFIQDIPMDLSKKTTSILIIEDDKGFNNILADFAKTRGFEVFQSFNGTDGLRLATQHVPSAIMLDINLPDINGWEVLKVIKDDPKLRNIQVHVMSAYDKETKSHPEHKEYLPKPVTLESLDKAFSSITMTKDKSLQRILVIEDNVSENRAISELLLSHHIESISAHSGKHAFELLQTEKVDCIILDLRLPDMGGYDIMEQLSKTPMKDIPIIVYSGKDLSEPEEVKLRKYANAIIIKNEYSYLRLMDEVKLFLHKMSEKLPDEDKYKKELYISGTDLKGNKVLVVDDDIRNIYSLYSILEREGMEIEVASNGKEALEKLDEIKGINLVLMDIMMPEMDGIECTQKIRQKPQLKNLPIIALTAKAMKGDREKCIEAGASDYISKPIDVNKLLSLMRVWLYDRKS